jgi:hypothetical protein
LHGVVFDIFGWEGPPGAGRFRGGNRPVRAHIVGMVEFVEWLTGTHTCGCGAEYKVTVTEVPTDDVACEKCGLLMDRRANRSFLTYERIADK